ncbi:MAG TPA: formyltransferase family protein [Chitinophagaceae bacterium]|jgi:methionyl-tRNA formyltransferase|nr:formyltransferase family protein [Chitinophagaceae bacterium]
MTNEVKALILCNNPIAVPGIREFLFYGKAGAIVVTKRNKEMQGLIRSLTEGTGVPLIVVTKDDLQEKLVDAITKYEINTGVVMTFPFILPEKIWNLPARGFINFHYGLLPQCRGPQPVLRHLLNNDAEAGITLHKVDGGIDTGEIIIQEKIKIADTDTYGSLQSKLAYLAAKPAANLLKILSYGSVLPSKPQDETKAHYYEMPGKDELTINWSDMSGEKITRLVNACNPWNKGAGTTINDWFIGITEVELLGETKGKPVGTVLTADEIEGLTVQTCDNRVLKINIVYTQEGFYSGHKLAGFGIKKGMQFV